MAIDFPNDPRGRELIRLIERAKYDRWLAREVERILLDVYEEAVRKILSSEYRNLSPTERARLAQLVREVEAHIQGGYSAAERFALSELGNYAELEARIAAHDITSIVQRAQLAGVRRLPDVNVGGLITRQLVQSTARLTDLPIQGLPFGDWWERQRVTMTSDVKRAIQQGIIEGKGPMAIVRRIIPERNQADPAVWRRARNEASILVRTTTNAVQNDAALESYRAAGDEISNSYRWLSIRDSRTSPICRALDGRVFRYSDETAPRPPAHLNCRSTTVPVFRPAIAKALGRDPSAPLTMQSYDQWLREQPAFRQNAILGPTRAEWYRARKMTLADAIDTDLRVLTLAQLRARIEESSLATAP